jgi:hypothetical protein
MYHDTLTNCEFSTTTTTTINIGSISYNGHHIMDSSNTINIGSISYDATHSSFPTHDGT